MAMMVAMRGVRFKMAAATGAPTFSMETTRKRRPIAVPTTPENTK